MIKGIKTLEDIDGILHTVRNEISRIDQEIDTLFEHSQKNKQHQSETIEALAKIYFTEIKKKDMPKSESTTSSISMDVHTLLQKRAVVYNQLLEDIKESNTKLTSLESERMQAHTLLDEAAKEVIAREHEVQTVLENDKDYQEQLAQTRAVQKISEEAENKAVEAEQTRIEKGYPYEGNVLFYYLWREKYGTSEYEGKRLIKVLDGWVASLSDYEKHRVNY